MSSLNSFQKKIVYISLVALLLIILPLISLPRSIKKENRDGKEVFVEATQGGILATMRKKHQLSQAEISEIDPASESMKLATLGLRPVAVTLLWNQVQDAKKKHQWDRLRTATHTLIALQPNFIKVWEFQAHNLSYNISREFDDYQYRYHWVKEGLSYLMTGIAYNRKDHRIYDNLGFFFGLKLGRSDEKAQFRRLFRRDDEYHNKMAGHEVKVEDITDETLGGADNWKAAYEWYAKSQNMVDSLGFPRRTSSLMFYKNRPSQLRNFAIDLENEEIHFEFPRDPAMRAWEKAYEEWSGNDNSYGKRELKTSSNRPVFLDRIAEDKERGRELRKELDELVPNLRKEQRDAREALMTEEMWKAYNTPYAELADRNQMALQMQAKKIMDVDEDVIFRVEVERRLASGDLKFTEEQRLEFDRINADFVEIDRNLNFTFKYRGAVNYSYWKSRCKAESLQDTLDARAALFEARKLAKLSKFESFEVIEGGEKKKKNGAIDEYLKSFHLWKKILAEFENLGEDIMEDDLIDAMKEYWSILRTLRMEWPLDFPLQELIDRRVRQRKKDDLPTSQDLRDRIEAEREKAAANQAEKGNTPDPKNGSNPSNDPPKSNGKDNPAGKSTPSKSSPDNSKANKKSDSPKSNPPGPAKTENPKGDKSEQPDKAASGDAPKAKSETPESKKAPEAKKTDPAK